MRLSWLPPMLILLMIHICAADVAAGMDFPSAFRQAKILEVGDMTFSISGTRTDFSSEFNDRGARVNGRDLVLRELTWRQFIQESPESERVQLRALQAQKVKLEDDIAIMEEVYSVAERTLIRPFWAFGLSDQWTLGARLSIVAENRLVSRKTEWTSNEGTQSRVLSRNQSVSGRGRRPRETKRDDNFLRVCRLAFAITSGMSKFLGLIW
ncbi:MAG: hypothetical protein IPK68_08105 [Bdellovibrionales bacterium]|nr:hypothetical protein [Bdellovibrionales bacterium]